MLVLRDSQKALFDSLTFESFIDRLAARLSAPDLSGYVDSVAARAAGAGGVRTVAEELVKLARQDGFDAEGDVVSYAVLSVISDESFRANPAYPWVHAALNARAYSGEERMVAVRGLLPERERRLCFGDDDCAPGWR